MVVRSELFARLLIHDLTGADAALERAEQAGVPRAERDLFAAWLAQQRGALTPAPPAAGLSLLLALMLEYLLRVQDFDNFESLLPLLHRMPVAERERREPSGPDVSAPRLPALGRPRMAGRLRPASLTCARWWASATLRWQTTRARPAATFASQALSLEPLSEAARSLLELASRRTSDVPQPAAA